MVVTPKDLFVLLDEELARLRISWTELRRRVGRSGKALLRHRARARPNPSAEIFFAALKQAGLTVYHVVPTLRAALKAVDAGVDGLIVEGGEGGGFKNPRPVSSLVLLPLVRSRVDVPIIAAGGICDGVSMVTPSGTGKSIGCEKPRLRLSTLPLPCAR